MGASKVTVSEAVAQAVHCVNQCLASTVSTAAVGKGSASVPRTLLRRSQEWRGISHICSLMYCSRCKLLASQVLFHAHDEQDPMQQSGRTMLGPAGQ
jgi:hypothetical protein